MVRRSQEARRRYGVGALASAVWQERTTSDFRPISSDAKAPDGLNVQIAVCDESASHRTPEVYDVLLTAMGKRRNPLLLAISKATGNTIIEHDGNPVLEWCIGNVVGHYDARSNVYARKARPEQKIDAAVALIMGIGRCLPRQRKNPAIISRKAAIC